MDRLGGKWDREDAEQFVRELFEHVLRPATPLKEQMLAWTRRAVASGDPKAIFRAFIETEAHQRDLEAVTDAGTKWPPGHFYSPLPSSREILGDRNRIFGPKSLGGVDLRPQHQLSLLEQLSRFFGSIPFDMGPTPGLRYSYSNPSYGYGDAIIYWAMLNYLQPQRIIEVGSGFSSALALDAIDILGLPTECTFIDPFPAIAAAATKPLRHPHKILAERIQDIDFRMVEELRTNDILFIDSSHVLKTGSDVHFELTELLPRLKPGVVVHFHDVFSSFEYPEKWILERRHGWNEIYAIHLFLMYNNDFKIEYFNQFVAKSLSNELRQICPTVADRILLNSGGGLWLRRA